MIDITKPLELSDGTPVELDMRDPAKCIEGGWINVKWGEPGAYWTRNFLLNDGSIRVPSCAGSDKRTLRNVKENEVRTGLEHLEQLEQLARKIAARVHPVQRIISEDEFNLARAIVAEIDGPQTDEEWVLHIIENDESLSLGGLVRTAIAKGRELANNEIVNIDGGTTVGKDKTLYEMVKAIYERQS